MHDGIIMVFRILQSDTFVIDSRSIRLDLQIDNNKCLLLPPSSIHDPHQIKVQK